MIIADQSYNIDFIDQSSISTFSRCPAKYFFSRVVGLEDTQKNTIHVDFGTDIHAALPHCYCGMSNLDVACDAFNRGWSQRKHGNEDSKRNTTRAKLMLADFIENHTPTRCDYEILPIAKQISSPEADRISDNEVPFAIDIGGCLPFLGRIDLPVKWKSTGQMWALDYKTASEISNRYFLNHYRSCQSVGYTLALQTLTGEEVKGMIIEALRVSPKNCENQLHHVWVTEKHMRLFIAFANAKAKSIMNCNDDKNWPQYMTGCGPYSMFGQPGFYCEYNDICDSEKWQDMAKHYNRRKPFHPFVIEGR